MTNTDGMGSVYCISVSAEVVEVGDETDIDGCGMSGVRVAPGLTGRSKTEDEGLSSVPSLEEVPEESDEVSVSRKGDLGGLLFI